MHLGEVQLSEFEYNLPEKFIAQLPKDKRDESKLLVMNRAPFKIEHRVFKDIPGYFSPGDCLVINKTKVLPAKVFCKKSTGGRVEILFLKKTQGVNTWAVLCRTNITGKNLFFEKAKESVECRAVEKTQAGEYVLEFSIGVDVPAIMRELGEMPLPPYIKRKAGSEAYKQADYAKYQTVYSKIDGSVAAPTAGLHFTPELLDRIREKGVSVAEITLHIGWGTFRTVISQDVSSHVMLPESYEIEEAEAEKINSAKKSGRKVFAVGTSAVRTLETAADAGGRVSACRGETGLFIYPGYKFKCVAAMITNLHTPKSTPLFLTSALAGRENIFKAYEAAMENNYRFYSYGDAMLIL